MNSLTDLVDLLTENSADVVPVLTGAPPVLRRKLALSLDQDVELQQRLADENKVIITKEALETLQRNYKPGPPTSPPTQAGAAPVNEAVVARMLNINQAAFSPPNEGSSTPALVESDLGASQPMPEHRQADAAAVCRAFRQLTSG
jgi:hypothetical protein